MSESSTEKKTPEADVPETKEVSQTTESETTEKKVPVKAVAKERAEKRAAREEAEAAKQELAKLKEQNPNLDMDAIAKVVAEVTSLAAQDAVEKHLEPLRSEVALRKTAMQHGLNEEQASKLAEIKKEAPQLSDERALAILKFENPDMFSEQRQASRAFDPRVHGGIPAGGDSPYRTGAERTDPTSLMKKAAQEGKRGEGSEAQHYAEQAFKERLLGLMPHLRRPS